MIRYYFIVAVLQICSHSTNAEESFNADVEEIKAHLRDERPSLVGDILLHGKRERILCDKLKHHKVSSICDRIMLHFIINGRGPDEFKSYGRRLPPGPFVGHGNPRLCRERSIDGLDLRKRMLWCEARFFYKMHPDPDGSSESAEGGFFLAGSRNTKGRVFVFRRSTGDTGKVSPVVEVDNVDEILRYKPSRGESQEDSAGSS